MDFERNNKHKLGLVNCLLALIMLCLVCTVQAADHGEAAHGEDHGGGHGEAAHGEDHGGGHGEAAHGEDHGGGHGAHIYTADTTDTIGRIALTFIALVLIALPIGVHFENKKHGGHGGHDAHGGGGHDDAHGGDHDAHKEHEKPSSH